MITEFVLSNGLRRAAKSIRWQLPGSVQIFQLQILPLNLLSLRPVLADLWLCEFRSLESKALTSFRVRSGLE